jgi:hypothetical protein
MKSLLLTIAVLSILVSSCGVCGCDAKYNIKTDGYSYSTNAIDENGSGCVSFIDLSTNEHKKICGSYTVTLNKDWKPKRKEY